MKTNTQNRPAARLMIVTAALVSLSAIASPAFAQTQAGDARWRSFEGCWEPTLAPASVGEKRGAMVCIVPSTANRSAQVVSIDNRKIVHVEQFNANGDRISKVVDKCPGWESAAFSKDGRRLFVRSNFTCGDSIQVKGSTVFSISDDGKLVHVQGNTVGKAADARVMTFKLAEESLAPDLVIADSAMIRTVPVEPSFADRAVRLNAAEPASVEAILELTKNADPQVAQAWVATFAKPPELNAKALVQLADAGMPGEVIDLLVAKSYPERFALQSSEGGVDAPRPTQADFARANGMNASCMSGFGRMYRGYYNSAFDCGFYQYGLTPFWGMNYYGGWGFPYGNYYYGSQPIIIVTRGADGEVRQPGRAVRGEGYQRGGNVSPTSSSSPRTSSGSSSGSSSSGSSSGGSSSTGRTAVPKGPPETSSSSSSSSSAGSSVIQGSRTAVPKGPPLN